MANYVESVRGLAYGNRGKEGEEKRAARWKASGSRSRSRTRSLERLAARYTTASASNPAIKRGDRVYAEINTGHFARRDRGRDLWLDGDYAETVQRRCGGGIYPRSAETRKDRSLDRYRTRIFHCTMVDDLLSRFVVDKSSPLANLRQFVDSQVALDVA